MSLTCFDVRYEADVAHLTLNHPERKNALIPAFWAELRTLVQDIDSNSRARVIVISSTGRHFCAGLDTSIIQGEGMFRGGADAQSTDVGRRRALLYQGIRSLQETFTTLERARVPIIAAIQGGCVGAGLAMVAACDMRYASQDAFFMVAETNIAITAEVGTLQRLPKIMPDGLVREMAYRGSRLPAVRAESVGFVSELFEDHEALLAGVSEIAAEIAGKSPLAIWGTKHCLSHARDHSVEDGLDVIALWQAGMYYPSESLETFRANADGRTPVYEDLRPSP